MLMDCFLFKDTCKAKLNDTLSNKNINEQKLSSNNFVSTEVFLSLQQELNELKQNHVEKSAYNNLEQEVKALRNELDAIKKLFNYNLIMKLNSD